MVTYFWLVIIFVFFFISDTKCLSFYSFHIKHSYKSIYQQPHSSGLNLNRFNPSLEKTISSLLNRICMVRYLKSWTPESHLLLLRYSDKDTWKLARFVQCSNPLLTCLTVTSGSTDAEFQRAIIIFERREKLSYSYYHAPTAGIRKRQSFCTSLPACFLSFGDEISRSCTTLRLRIIMWL